MRKSGGKLYLEFPNYTITNVNILCWRRAYLSSLIMFLSGILYTWHSGSPLFRRLSAYAFKFKFNSTGNPVHIGTLMSGKSGLSHLSGLNIKSLTMCELVSIREWKFLHVATDGANIRLFIGVFYYYFRLFSILNVFPIIGTAPYKHCQCEQALPDDPYRRNGLVIRHSKKENSTLRD